MLAARKAVTFTSSLTGRNALQFRTTVISGPPRNRIPFSEKAALGVTMALGIVAVPAWVLANLKHYRGA